MTENDMIAEYVKEKCPEILKSADFALYKLRKSIEKIGEQLVEGIKKIDFSKVSQALAEREKEK